MSRGKKTLIVVSILLVWAVTYPMMRMMEASRDLGFHQYCVDSHIRPVCPPEPGTSLQIRLMLAFSIIGAVVGIPWIFHPRNTPSSK